CTLFWALYDTCELEEEARVLINKKLFHKYTNNKPNEIAKVLARLMIKMAAGVRVGSSLSEKTRAVEEDSISSLPDEILQHILCFLPTESAIRTSLLSKRWKRVWCGTPCISFSSCTLMAASNNNTQDRYTAQKMMRLHLRTGQKRNVKNINAWIELAMNRRVESLSLELNFKSSCCNYIFPDSFFSQSSLKELSLALRYKPMIVPKVSLSWTYLKKLSLRSCKLSDESLATILSGCPVLQSLMLWFCDDLTVVDLSNSPSLTSLVVHNSLSLQMHRSLQMHNSLSLVTPMQILAPHIRYLGLGSSKLKLLPTLVDVSSLAEAKLNLCCLPLATTDGEFHKVTVLTMMESLQNVEKLSFGKQFLELFSFPELLGVPFPMMKVKDLTLEAMLHEYVIPPGIERLLQNSPDLKKLHIRNLKTQPGVRRRRSKSRWDAESKDVATFMELMFKNIETLEKMVVRVYDCYLEARGFKEMVQTLSHNNNKNVSIVMAAGVRVGSSLLEKKRAVEEDSISSLPDEILQHILCFLPTEIAIRTSLLSKRWRRVWCDTPCISFASCTLMSASRNKTQDRYTAQKMMSLQLRTGQIRSVNHVSAWTELAMNRRVESLSLELDFKTYNYTFPDSFFIQSSLKELSLASRFKLVIVPKASVSWTSLKKLSLRRCKLSDESLATILSGCPVLESLTLWFCDDPTVVDLSNSPSLRTLEVHRSFDVLTPMQILAPHIRCLRLDSTNLLPTLVDVSSLAEAKLSLRCDSLATDGELLKVAVLMMLESLQNVEKLSFGEQFLELLSFPDLLGVPFPMLKVKDLTLKATLHEYVVIPPGIERLLQNSPDLKKLQISNWNTQRGVRRRRSQSRWDAESKEVATFMELMFENIKTLEKMVVRVDDYYHPYLEARGFKEMVQTLSHNNNKNVSIVISDTR
ncbi:unnamed protein product, partial [Thlaspi arvense]